MLKLGHLSFRGKCPKHPAYNPAAANAELDPGCRVCQWLTEIYAAHGQLLTLVRSFPARHREFLPAPRTDATLPSDSQMALFAPEINLDHNQEQTQ